MSKQLIKQLEEMVGKSYQYGNRTHKVIRVFPDTEKERFSLKTDLETYERSFESGLEFLSHWKTANEVQQPETASVAVFEKENTMVDKLTELLMDNITKVQADAAYIKQAQSINNNVNSIINLTKLKLEVLKAARVRK